MEILQRRITHDSRTDTYALWFVGDLHLGSAACDEAAITEMVKAVKADPMAMWVGLGDLAEFIPRHDWRSRQNQMAKWLRGLEVDYGDDLVAREIEEVVERLKPIAGQCLGLLRGNHEDHILRQFDRNVQREVCRALGVIDLTDEAWIRLVFSIKGGANRVRAFDVYAHHGWFAGRKAGGKVNNLHDLFASYDVDIAAVGHGHERLVAPPLVTLRLASNGEITERRRYALMTGAFMRSHMAGETSYASAKGYRPNDVGAVCVYLTPDTRRLEARI